MEERWIWTELLSFDCDAPDRGVGAYLECVGTVPDGISLMTSALDFVVLHAGMKKEVPLFPDVCARFGHAGNEVRMTQCWSNFALRDLVAQLRKRGVKVFFSIFPVYQENRFHTEWASAHPEVMIVYDDLGVTPGIDLIARLDDGTLLEDLFTERLEEVLVDYGFDGFHGPDCCGPGGMLAHNDYADGIVAQFVEYLGDRAPQELKSPTGHVVEHLMARAGFIWQSWRQEWIDFHCSRWESCWRKIVAVARKHGRETMINSANTKGAFEGLYQFGIDYRAIARLGVDYLVVETVAGNMALIYGGYDYHFDFAAVFAELRAFVPEMKLLFLHGVKDVVESYDLLRHAPARLEREFFTLSQQFQITPYGELRRCADGFMMCLGDGLSRDEWRWLKRQWDLGFAFEAESAGDFTWIWDDTMVDALRSDYPRFGTWPAFKQVGRLTANYDLQIAVIAPAGRLNAVKGPLFVPNADLLPEAVLRQLVEYERGPVVVVGNFPPGTLPEDSECVRLCVGGDYWLTAARLHSPNPGCRELPGVSERFQAPVPPAYFWHPTDYMAIPPAFWDAVAALLERSRAGKVTVERPESGLRLLTLAGAHGQLRTALISTVAHYLTPEWHYLWKPQKVTKTSSFPYTPVTLKNGEIRSGLHYSPLHIPPYGIIVLDTE